MYGYLNVGSLVLGLIAWILPIVRIGYLKKSSDSNGDVFSLLSFSAWETAFVIYMQEVYVGRDGVRIEYVEIDFSSCSV